MNNEPWQLPASNSQQGLCGLKDMQSGAHARHANAPARREQQGAAPESCARLTEKQTCWIVLITKEAMFNWISVCILGW